jgi:AcrR family transcriptional regulator
MTSAAADRRRASRDAKRAKILAEAWELGKRDGLAAISLRDLGGRVGLRQPSLYVYFESKLDLYDAMFADGYRQLLELVGRRRRAQEPQAALTAYVRDIVRFCSENVERHQLLFQRTIPGFEPSPDSYRLAVEFYDLARAHLAAAGVTRRNDLDLFTAMVAGLTHQQVANDPGGRRWVRLAGPTVAMFLADVQRRRQGSTATGPRRHGR